MENDKKMLFGIAAFAVLVFSLVKVTQHINPLERIFKGVFPSADSGGWDF